MGKRFGRTACEDEVVAVLVMDLARAIPPAESLLEPCFGFVIALQGVAGASEPECDAGVGWVEADSVFEVPDGFFGEGAADWWHFVGCLEVADGPVEVGDGIFRVGAGGLGKASGRAEVAIEGCGVRELGEGAAEVPVARGHAGRGGEHGNGGGG